MTRPLALIPLLVLISGIAAAQYSSSAETHKGPAPSVSQSIEFGGRISDFSGNSAVRDTLVDLHSGPRLLSQWLEVNTPRDTGQLFDQLTLSSFGFGGDPNSVARARISKDGIYKFSAVFRRDKNFFDYNLLANPLNPANSNPAISIGSSPHAMETVRRMSDLDLTLLPQHRLSVRLGYSSNNNEGPSFSTVRQGTEAELLQDWRNATYTYRAGVDVRWPRRTVISYDQLFTLNKADTTWALSALPLQLPDGTPEQPGIVFNTPAGQPCAAPIANAATTPITADPNCNGYTGYTRSARTRTFFPTEQLSLQSNALRNFDLTARFIYTGAESEAPNTAESFLGFTARNHIRDLEVTGPLYVKRVNITTDAAFTWHVSERLRLSDSFRWADSRIPGAFASQQDALFAADMTTAPNSFNPATCAAVISPDCPQHIASSPADIILQDAIRFLGQDAKTNTLELEYDFTSHFGARIGYRFRNRFITVREVNAFDESFFPTLPDRGDCAGRPLVNGVCTFTASEDEARHWEINEHSALFGFWLRAGEKFRLNYDMELLSADNSFTRLSPRKRFDYSLRGTYKPIAWANFTSTIHLLDIANDQADINHHQHARDYNFNLALSRSDRWGLDLGYAFSDVYSQSDVCFVSAPVGSTTSCGTPFLRTLSLYDVHDHYGDVHLFLKPTKKLTTTIGYTLTSTAGMTTDLIGVQPAGPLAINYHLPEGALEYKFTNHWTGRAAWNHYGYNEKSDPGLTLPRDMRGNVYTFSVRFTTGDHSQ